MPRRPGHLSRQGDRGPLPGTAAPGAARRRRGGFALLITITLLAFLVLLLVSLSSFTRVETQVTTNSQSLVQARQNALLALNIALGQLQKYAGPDQRVTAEADISPTLTRQPNCRWTGVYGSAIAGNYSEPPENIQSDLADATKVNASNGSQAQLLTWLVSGNEPAPFNPTTDVGASGQIVNVPATSAIPFQPGQTVGNLSVGANATGVNFTVTNAAGSQPAQLLVGPGSTNTDVPLTGASTTTPVDYVVAPLVNITSNVTGVGNGVTVGRYAWWVGDEGVKARVNLPLVSAAANATVQNNAFVTPTRDGIELMAGTTGNSTAAGGPVTQSNAPVIGAGYDVSRATSLLDGNQLPLLNAGNATLGIFTLNRFHDLTGYSYSVLSDAYAGGLKKDLTRLLLDPSPPANVTDPASSSAADIGPTSQLFAPSSVGGIDSYIPTWGILRNWAQTTPAADGTISPQLPATTPVGGVPIPTQTSISPVLTYYSLGFRYATNGPVSDGAAIQVNLYPIVVLWNPYTVPLAAHVYEVGIAPAPWQNSLNTSLQNSPDGNTWTPVGNTTCNFTQITGTSGKNEYILFRVDCPQIAPGQSLVFSVPSATSGTPYTNIGANAAMLENMVPDPRYYVVKSLTGTIPTGQSGYDYRVTSTAFGNGSGGTVYMYLGEPSSNPATANFDSNAQTSNQDLYSTAIPKQWYQANQNIGWDNISVPNNTNQSGLYAANDLTATPPGPAFVVYGQAIFSGEGSNANIDYGGANQMFTRWIAQGNMRAPITARTRLDNNYNVLYAANAGPNSGNSAWQHFVMGTPTSATIQASAGLGHDWISNAGSLSPVNVSLFEVRSNSQPNFLSIGQLQHAPVSMIGAYPSYAIGNSLSDFRLNGNTVVNSSPYAGGSAPSAGAGLSYLQKAYYDVSWLLNRSLWDRYYFSTIPSTASGQTAVPANPRLVPCDSPSATTLQDPNNAASGLLVAGGFNINSTSVQAWRAVLAGACLPGGSYTPPGLPASTAGNVPFSRFARPTATNTAAAENNATDPWEGYRTLTQLQITTLAQNIVTQIRAYGPFVSLADFVNRRLLNTSGLPTGTPPASALGLKGPLQAAIDAQTTSSANPNSTNALQAINDSTTAFWNPNNPAIAGNYNGQPYFTQNGWGTFSSTAAGTTSPISNRSAYAPQYLTQADILSALGPILSPRSDTFRIRTYGETRNPVTQAVTGRAWCEAIVQRVPDYVDPADAAANPPATPLNKSFGRQFKVVSFRWLSPSDI